VTGPLVTVLVPAALRTECDGAGRLEVPARPRLADVLDEVRERWPRLERRLRDERGELRRYVNVYVDGDDCRSLDGLATPVPAGAEVQVIPSVAGG
jgi:molybdopterin synthase sulfur carrier subunit